MEQNQPNEKNKTVVVILAFVLGLALGLVGYMLYNHYLVEDKEKTTENQTSQVDSQQPETKEVCAEAEKICLDYPADWTVDPKVVDYPDRDSEMAKDLKDDQFVKTDRLKSHNTDNTAEVYLTSGISGIGGICNAGEGGKFYQVRKQKTNITGYDAKDGDLADAYAVAVVVSDKNNKFTPMIGLSNSKAIVEKTEGDRCDAAYFSLVSGRNTDLGVMTGETGVEYGLVSLGTVGTFANGEAKTYSSLEEAKKVLETEGYKQAFDIVASAKYKS